MLNGDVSWIMALGAGFASFFTPCILPMIPAYIMYITGESLEDLESNRWLALSRTLAFVLGFTIIFMIMGSSASFIGKIFIQNKKIFSKLSGLILMIFGLNMLGIINIKFLNLEKRSKAPTNVKGWMGAILMGMAFAAGWTPCFGPVLGSILMYAGGSGTVLKGTMLLLVYSIGMAIPFILTALFINVFLKMLDKGEKVIMVLPKVSGIILIIFGVLVFFDKMTIIGNYLLKIIG